MAALQCYHQSAYRRNALGETKQSFRANIIRNDVAPPGHDYFLALAGSLIDRLRHDFPRGGQLLVIPRLSFARFLRICKICRLDFDSNTPSLSAIGCFCSVIRLLCSSKIYEKIAMIPSSWITEDGSSWNYDLTDSLPENKSVMWRDCQPKEQYAHIIPREKLADVRVNSIVIRHARQTPNE